MRSSSIGKLRVRRYADRCRSRYRAGTLSAWLKAAGVPIRKPGHPAAPPGPDETTEQEATGCVPSTRT